MSLEEFLRELREAAKRSGIVKKEEVVVLEPPRTKIRYHLIDESYIDVFANLALDKQYYHWQRVNGRIYRVNNHPPEGWHEHIDVEERKRSLPRKIMPYEFFTKVRGELSK